MEKKLFKSILLLFLYWVLVFIIAYLTWKEKMQPKYLLGSMEFLTLIVLALIMVNLFYKILCRLTPFLGNLNIIISLVLCTGLCFQLDKLLTKYNINDKYTENVMLGLAILFNIILVIVIVKELILLYRNKRS